MAPPSKGDQHQGMAAHDHAQPVPDRTAPERTAAHHEEYEDGGHVSADVGPERFLMGHDALAMLTRMPEEDGSLLLLVGVEDLSYREAAAVFGVPQGTVVSRLSRARARLRSMVEGGGTIALRRVK